MERDTILSNGVHDNIKHGIWILYILLLASRSAEFAQQAKVQLRHDNVDFLIVDLTSFKSVHQFIDQVRQIIPKGGIDLLISKFIQIKKKSVHHK